MLRKNHAWVFLLVVGCGSIAPENELLTIQQSGGDGTGTVVSLVDGVNCEEEECVVSLPIDTQITLIARPTENSVFVRWAEGCEKVTAGNECIVTLSQAHKVVAVFALKDSARQVIVHPAGAGQVIVTSANGTRTCDQTCILQFMRNEEVTLTAERIASNRFLHWVGDCTGNEVDCTLTVDGAKQVDAIFERGEAFVRGTNRSVWGSIEQLKLATENAVVDDPTVRFDELELCVDVDQDIHCATRESRNSQWEKAQPMEVINSACQETTPRISADGLMLLFASRRTNDGKGCTVLNLYQTKRQSLQTPWEKPSRIPNVSSLDAHDHSPTPSHDGLTILFYSERPLEEGVEGVPLPPKELYVTTRPDLDSDIWTTPVRIEGSISGAPPNSWGPSGLLAFSANGDLWVASASRQGIVKPLEILGFNTPDVREADGVVSRDLRTLYYAADINGISKILVAKHK